MASLAVCQAIESRLTANFTAVRLWATPNTESQAPSDGAPFLLISYPVANEDIVGLGVPGQRLYRETGAFVITLCVNRGEGTGQALAWIETLRTLFRGVDGTSMASGLLITYAPSPAVEDITEADPYYRLSFATPYQFDLQG